MHTVKDIYLNRQADLILQKVIIKVDWIDTGLLLCFIRFKLVRIFNESLEVINNPPLIPRIEKIGV